MKILVLLFTGMTVSVQNNTKGMEQGRETEGLAKKRTTIGCYALFSTSLYASLYRAVAVFGTCP
jgi:vancomycin permeability regulator SanA